MKYRSTTFYTSEQHIAILGDAANPQLKGSFSRLDVPLDAEANLFGDRLLVELRSEWLGHLSGSLLSFEVQAFVSGDRTCQVLFSPTREVSFSGYSSTKSFLVLNLLDNVKTLKRMYVYSAGSGFTQVTAPFPYPVGVGVFDDVSVWALDEDRSDVVWLTATGYLNPTSLYLVDLATSKNTPKHTPTKPLRSLPSFFDASECQVQQFFATSKDGTQVPYFQISSSSFDQPTPTILYGYGGFEISMLPSYSVVTGIHWLEKGHTYVVANSKYSCVYNNLLN